jgi:hypothetical protein
MSLLLPRLDLSNVISDHARSTTDSIESIDMEDLPLLRASYRYKTPRDDGSDAASETPSRRSTPNRGPFIYTPAWSIANHNAMIFDGLGSSDIFLRRLEEAEGRDERRIARRRSVPRCSNIATARFGSFSDSDSETESGGST